MKLVANIKLLPTPEQAVLLQQTLKRCNEACNWLSEVAFERKIFRHFALQKLVYRDLRDRFSLTAQVAIRCLAKVADAYKIDTDTRRQFRPHSAQPFDDRIFRFLSDDQLSIWTLGGRQKIAYVCGDHQRRLLAHRRGEVDLMFVRGNWYLAVVCDFDDPDLIETTDVLGVDFGIVNIATDSDGKPYTGEAIEAVRVKLGRRRGGLQSRGTKAAKRKLKRMSGRQRRFQTHSNHCISKALVTEAKRSGRAISLEDLKGIRDRVKATGASQRARLHNWAFSQLRTFVTYKARMLGVPILFVDPRNTSRTCPACGCIDKRNRPNQATFSCVSCGHAGPADFIAARNIRSRARASVTVPAVLGA
jgi:putative transposase